MNPEVSKLTSYNLVIHSPSDNDFVIKHNGAQQSKFLRKWERAGGHELRGDESKADLSSSDFRREANLGSEKFDQIWPSLTKFNQFYCDFLEYREGDEKPTYSRASRHRGGTTSCATVAEGGRGYESSDSYHNSLYLADQKLQAADGQIQQLKTNRYSHIFSDIIAYYRLLSLYAKKSWRIHPAFLGISRILTLVLLFSFAPGAIRAAELNVFAAASLTDALKEIGTNYEKQTADKVVLNLGASSLLARQIEEGAPADIFFSADEARMDQLEKKELVLKGTRKSRLSNSLVIVTAADSGIKINSPADLADAKIKRIALADPKAVPAGVYSKAWLEKENLWTAVEPKVVPTDNVRAALAAVESGNIEIGMVFKTDATISKKVKVAYEIPTKDSPKISYPVALMKNSRSIEPARKFLKYLDSNDAAKIFEKYGFIVLK